MLEETHQTKRSLTDAGRSASSASFTTSATSLIDEDLHARLQNMGTRVRQSVTEGYNTHRSFINDRQPFARSTSIPALPSGSTPIFRSNIDILDDVHNALQFSTGSSGVALKRGRVDEETGLEPDMDICVDEPNSSHMFSAPSQTTAGNASALPRPIKPLRAPRAFGQTQSLPAAIFGGNNQGGSLATVGQNIQSAVAEEEEDWSSTAFADSFSPSQASS